MIHDFFKTWGIVRFQPIHPIWESTDDNAYLLCKNVLEYIPVIGNIVGVACIAYHVIQIKKGNTPVLRESSTALKVGLLAHDILGALGIGIVCLPLDIAVSSYQYLKMRTQCVQEVAEATGKARLVELQ